MNDIVRRPVERRKPDTPPASDSPEPAENVQNLPHEQPSTPEEPRLQPTIGLPESHTSAADDNYDMNLDMPEAPVDSKQKKASRKKAPIVAAVAVFLVLAVGAVLGTAQLNNKDNGGTASTQSQEADSADSNGAGQLLSDINTALIETGSLEEESEDLSGELSDQALGL